MKWFKDLPLPIQAMLVLLALAALGSISRCTGAV